ncbi:sigma-70 family RNA polymerase sigma factor [Sandaracinus amylolyticus]|nr:sigma-70 family RNA polymerase sigma factor [Sandaracinus amylolyticus]
MTRARRDAELPASGAGTRPSAAKSPAGPRASDDDHDVSGESEASRLASDENAADENLDAAVNPEASGASDPDDASPDRDAAETLDAAALEKLGDELPPAARAPEDRERDRELVRRAQQGDQRAFRELFDRYHKRAYAVAFGVLKNKHDALDVVQESFVKVHRHLDGFQGSSSFYTWLYRIVMNLAIDQLRRKKTARPVEYDDAIDREGALADEHVLPRMLDANPRRTVIRRELMQRVEEALATLPEYHRQVIVLREIEGLSYEEMAEVLEVPKGTIMSRLFHARRKMQVALQDFVEGGDLEVEE